MMAIFRDTRNPFTIQTPEDMPADDVVELFVDVLTEYPGLDRKGHVFLHGPRGSGKSMMFRYLQPDCQRIARACTVRDLPFFGLYIPVKKNEITLPELQRFERHANAMINEHFLVMHIAERLCAALEGIWIEPGDHPETAATMVKEFLPALLRDCGWAGEPPSHTEQITVTGLLQSMHDLFRRLYTEVKLYIKRLAYSQEPATWDGPLCGYVDFLCPLLAEVKKLPIFPDKPVFLLIDDADALSLTQTRVLNTWVASRTTSYVSLKVSTQYRYKTYRTVSGQTIDTPHDFAEVNISAVYTASRRANYMGRVRQIIQKRLRRLAGIKVSPEEFFPEDTAQERSIKAIAEEHRNKWDTEGRGYRPSDDSYRYARPDYMKSLAGPSKSTPTYSYAGFGQLVHISSGIIRDFLEPAAIMFNTCVSHHPEDPAKSIPPDIQNTIIRSYSSEFMFSEFERMRSDQAEEKPPIEDIEKLQNLIEVLGGTFRQILLSDRSERRVFSIAFSDRPDEELVRVLRLGIQQGYFHESYIGNKDGTGRTPLYILSRKLSPHFKLDPTSFAGYLFVTREAIWEALLRPDRLLRKIKNDGADSVFEQRQLKLFD